MSGSPEGLDPSPRWRRGTVWNVFLDLRSGDFDLGKQPKNIKYEPTCPARDVLT